MTHARTDKRRDADWTIGLLVFILLALVVIIGFGLFSLLAVALWLSG